MIDANVGAGKQMRIDGLDLVAGEDLVFNGMAETDGSFLILSGAGNDILVGGAKNDTIEGGAGNDTIYALPGNDVLEGGLGADFLSGGYGNNVFVYDSAADSTGTAFDTIDKFSSYVEKIDLPFTVSGWTGTMSGALNLGSFNTDLAAVDGILEANSVVLFTASSGDMNGRTFAVFDVNGDGAYVAGQDMVIEFQTPVALPTDTVHYFI
jgi:Ca2+-binding RTX toxin-like protein